MLFWSTQITISRLIQSCLNSIQVYISRILSHSGEILSDDRQGGDARRRIDFESDARSVARSEFGLEGVAREMCERWGDDAEAEW